MQSLDIRGHIIPRMTRFFRSNTPIAVIREIVICGVLLLGLQGAALCQVATTGDLPAMPSEAETGSVDAELRMTAFAKLIGVLPKNYFTSGIHDVPSVLTETFAKQPELAETRKILLIGLLENENKIVSPYTHKEGQTLSEGYVNYLGDLIWAVSSLHDVRSMNALLGVLPSGGMATRTLISFGKIALTPVIDRLLDPDLLVRATVVQMLPPLLDVSDISKDPEAKSKIRNALVQASKDKEFLVRSNSIAGLIEIGDAECISIVVNLAQSDPYQADFMDNRYLVREVAAKALASR